MRLIDVEPIERKLFKEADKSLAKNPYEKARICAFRQAFEMILSAPTVSPLPNNPLTLEELREMDGEPVWIAGVSSVNNFKGHWDICDWENGEVVSFPYCAETPCINDYGITWLAYRRKSEGGDRNA